MADAAESVQVAVSMESAAIAATVTVTRYVWSLQQFAVKLALAGAQVPSGASARLYYLHAVGEWMPQSAVESILTVTVRALCASMERAQLSQVDLAKVASDRSEIERCDHRLKAVNARGGVNLIWRWTSDFSFNAWSVGRFLLL
jgi:hypothetical protein